MVRRSDTFNLKITATFRTPNGNVYYIVDNQPTFDYVVYHGGRYYTGLGMRPEITDWLFNTDKPTFDVFGSGNYILKRVEFKEEMTEEVFYSSVHHIDER